MTQRHFMLEVVERLPGGKFRCRCDCGGERVINVGHFNAGAAKSCGCTRFQKYTDGAHGPCIIEGCGSERCNSRGYCWMHYTRWRRHGDPTHTENGHPQEWLDAHVAYQGSDCLAWPFGGRDNGYGTLVYGGEHCSAHRKMCEMAHGKPPTSEHEAAHSCGNGNEGCVNPNHLSWKTPSENQADKLIHGTHNRGERSGSAKLTEADVREIRRRYKPYVVTIAALAREFKVSHGAVSCIIRGVNWSWLQ